MLDERESCTASIIAVDKVFFYSIFKSRKTTVTLNFSSYISNSLINIELKNSDFVNNTHFT